MKIHILLVCLATAAVSVSGFVANVSIVGDCVSGVPAVVPSQVRSAAGNDTAMTVCLTSPIICVNIYASGSLVNHSLFHINASDPSNFVPAIDCNIAISVSGAWSGACDLVIGVWSAWSAACGVAVRNRTVACVYPDGRPEPCSLCVNPPLVAARLRICSQSTEVVRSDFCNATTKTCHVSQASPVGWNTPATFLADPLPSNGWTLVIFPRLENGSTAIYSLYPTTILWSNFTIQSAVADDPVLFRVVSQPNKIGQPCALFAFTGWNIVVQDIHIELSTEPSCVWLPGALFRQSALFFSGGNISLTRIHVSHASVVFSVRSDQHAGFVRGQQLSMDSPVPVEFGVSEPVRWVGHVVTALPTTVAMDTTYSIVTSAILQLGSVQPPPAMQFANTTDVSALFWSCPSPVARLAAPSHAHVLFDMAAIDIILLVVSVLWTLLYGVHFIVEHHFNETNP
jgi:hypothetical protein